MKTITLLTPASITATGVSPDTDISGLAGVATVNLVSANTAGTTPTLACKLQSSVGLQAGYEQTVAGATDNKLFTSSTTDNAIAAKFTQSGARSIKKVALMLKRNGTIEAEKLLTLKLLSDDSGPDATLGTFGTVLVSSLKTSYDLVVFTLSTPVDVANDAVLYLELTADYDAHDTNNVTWRSATVASGGNFLKKDDDTWAATSTQNLESKVEQYVFADVTGGGFTTVATALNTTVQTKTLHARSLPRFMRVHSTVTGTDNPAFATAVILNAFRTQRQ